MTVARLQRGPADGLEVNIGPILPSYLQVTVGLRSADVVADPDASVTRGDRYELVHHEPDQARSWAVYVWAPPATTSR